MTKEQAAKELGISPRSVIRFAQRGRLKVVYAAKANGGKVALYDPTDVAALKIELEAEKAKPRTPPPVTPADGGALVRAGKMELQPFLEQLTEALTTKPRAVPIEAQLVLSLTQAAQFSGLPRRVLVEAIKAERLRGSRDWGRGWRVRRGDLEAFVESL